MNNFYGKKFDWKQDLKDNRWTIIGFIAPAIIAPIISFLIAETFNHFSKKKKKKR